MCPTPSASTHDERRDGAPLGCWTVGLGVGGSTGATLMHNACTMLGASLPPSAPQLLPLSARSHSVSRCWPCRCCPSRSASTFRSSRLACSLARRLVCTPVLLLVLATAVNRDVAGAAALVVPRVQLARCAALQRAALQRGSGQTSFFGCLACRQQALAMHSVSNESALFQNAAARKVLPPC